MIASPGQASRVRPLLRAISTPLVLSFSPRLALDRAPLTAPALPLPPLSAASFSSRSVLSSSTTTRSPRPRPCSAALAAPLASLSLSLLFIGSRPLREYASAYPFLFSFMYASTSRYEFSDSLSLDLNGEQAL